MDADMAAKHVPFPRCRHRKGGEMGFQRQQLCGTRTWIPQDLQDLRSHKHETHLPKPECVWNESG